MEVLKSYAVLLGKLYPFNVRPPCEAKLYCFLLDTELLDDFPLMQQLKITTSG